MDVWWGYGIIFELDGLGTKEGVRFRNGGGRILHPLSTM